MADFEYKHYRYYPKGKWRWPNFTPREMACKGNKKLMINEDAMDKLQALRDGIGKPMIVLSAYRTPDYNRKVKGAKHSMHMKARAFDISMANHKPAEFERMARSVGFTGFGFYKKRNFMHIDTGRKREWGKRWWSEKPVELPPKKKPEVVRKKGLLELILDLLKILFGGKKDG